MIGSKLKELRMQHNLTQKQFSELFELSESVISLYESNKRSPSYDILIKIVKHFNISVDYLLGLADEKYLSSAAESSPADIEQDEEITSEKLTSVKQKRAFLANFILDQRKIKAKDIDTLERIITSFSD